jgi:uncharacterized protein (DUF1697 family)
MKKTDSKNLRAYAAFLRGINVGGRTIKMVDLKKALAKSGLRDIQTLGASGNVLFSSAEADPAALAKSIEAGLQKAFGCAIAVLVRTLDQVRALVASDLFKGVAVSPNTRLYITFLSTPTKPKNGLGIPYTTPAKNMSILSVSKTEICSVVEVSKEFNTIDLMEIIEKEFGKNLTTRNWNTIKKVAEADAHPLA